jgi:thiol-disulfide isomerase/thioredoxin
VKQFEKLDERFLTVAARMGLFRSAAVLGILFLAGFAEAQPGALVTAVRERIAQHDLANAERVARAWQTRNGASPELAASISWLARGALAERKLDQADAWAGEAAKLSAALLMGRKLDDDAFLVTAQGAAIEVHAQVLAARGERPEALEYLRAQLKQFRGTSLAERIGKNINLLTMEGKPAPELETAQWLGLRPPKLAALRGSPVLLFFWAHWCSDCKGEVEILAKLRRTFAGQRLAIVGPTRLYGYVAGGEDAPPDQERRYIQQVKAQYYAPLANMPSPLSAANFVTYGASTTPTLVLIDRAGVVRYYHPGAASEAELTAMIRDVLKR